MSNKCPRCGNPVKRSYSSKVQLAGGLAGSLLYALFGPFHCEHCGIIKRNEFPIKIRIINLTKSLLILTIIPICIFLYINGPIFYKYIVDYKIPRYSQLKNSESKLENLSHNANNTDFFSSLIHEYKSNEAIRNKNWQNDYVFHENKIDYLEDVKYEENAIYINLRFFYTNKEFRDVQQIAKLYYKSLDYNLATYAKLDITNRLALFCLLAKPRIKAIKYIYFNWYAKSEIKGNNNSKFYYKIRVNIDELELGEFSDENDLREKILFKLLNESKSIFVIEDTATDHKMRDIW